MLPELQEVIAVELNLSSPVAGVNFRVFGGHGVSYFAYNFTTGALLEKEYLTGLGGSHAPKDMVYDKGRDILWFFGRSVAEIEQINGTTLARDAEFALSLPAGESFVDYSRVFEIGDYLYLTGFNTRQVIRVAKANPSGTMDKVYIWQPIAPGVDAYKLIAHPSKADVAIEFQWDNPNLYTREISTVDWSVIDGGYSTTAFITNPDIVDERVSIAFDAVATDTPICAFHKQLGENQSQFIVESPGLNILDVVSKANTQGATFEDVISYFSGIDVGTLAQSIRLVPLTMQRFEFSYQAESQSLDADYNVVGRIPPQRIMRFVVRHVPDIVLTWPNFIGFSREGIKYELVSMTQSRGSEFVLDFDLTQEGV